MEWGKIARHRRLLDAAVAAGSAALCMTVGFAQSSGVSVYPRLVDVAAPTLLWLGSPLPPALAALYAAVPWAGCALLMWRRRRPVAICVVLVVAATATPLAPAALVALFTVASMCSARTTAAVTALALIPVPLYLVLDPFLTAAVLAAAVTGGVLVGAAVGWGLFLRGLHERGEQLRARAAWRAEQIRQREREALAREMHDVLAHRLSLLSVHAGALELNREASPAQVAQAAGVIRSSAHQAMEDLQKILGVLRTPLQPDGSDPEPPQPALGDLTRLLDESRSAGMRVDVDQDIAEPGAVPATIGRTVYRIVQEALTNAHKHAPGQAVHIHLHGTPGTGLDIAIMNDLSDSGSARLPGSGSGLSGLRERAALVGGSLSYGRTERTHEVRAHLPWPA
ncbi:sensor histidine kinase [Streptomyces sp. CMB-StM0423]|uniref:sensor histidine kinase n=1 Tax=Streptomyces sp. CMB-StM0423 TaxID=2059884 RepID=UPI000C70CE12|nr:histidine kinase [Streptomyces sp. CMB-StM0423]AUH44407.1 sensor histidine kinase [Streptomyces sp. CMB-StM0423]